MDGAYWFRRYLSFILWKLSQAFEKYCSSSGHITSQLYILIVFLWNKLYLYYKTESES